MTDLVFNPLEIECGFSVSVSVWVRKSFERQMEGKLHMWPLINDRSACDHFNFSRHLYSFFPFFSYFQLSLKSKSTRSGYMLMSLSRLKSLALFMQSLWQR